MGLVVVVFLLLAIAWLSVRAYLARGHLLEVRSEVARLQSDVTQGRTTELRPGLAAITDDAKAAHDLTSDPVWRAASYFPILGRTLRTSGGLAAATDQVARNALPQLVEAATYLDPAQVRRGDGSLDLARLTAASPFLERADAALGATRATVGELPSRGLIGPVATARTQLDDQLGDLAGSLDAATRASRIGPAMLGSNGSRRYLVLFQNPAEARGTGGLSGSYAIMRADNGKLTRERAGSDSELRDAPGPVTDLGPEFTNRWRAESGDRAWRAANYTPHFPHAAEVWQKLWERQSGQKIDGVIAVDPIALSYLLDVVGSITLSDGEVLDSDNVAQWTMSDEYIKYADDNERRKEVLTDLAEKAFDKINSGGGRSAALLEALGKAVGEHRVLTWSPRPVEQDVIAGTPLAGAVLDTSGPLAAVVLNNGGGNKLDYYVDRSLTYEVTRCESDVRAVRAVIQLTNTAPPSGLPAYVGGRVDGRESPPGQSRTYVSYFSTSGSEITAASLDGERVQLVNARERGRPVVEADVEIPAGESRTLVLEYTEPVVEGALSIPVQPLARPMTLRVDDECPSGGG